MTSAFVDSVVLIAAMLRRDQHHEPGLRVVRAADQGTIGPLVLTDLVLAETINYLTSRGGSAVGREALDRIERSAGFEVERVPDSVYAAGKNDVYRRFDGLSFVDALTVAFMRQRGLERVYSFDADFDRVDGIVRLEGPSGD